MPYRETKIHRPNYHKPPPEIIEREPEYKVEAIIGSQRTRRCKGLQYWVCWKGYSIAHDFWEPANQIHAPDLIRKYQMMKLKKKLQIQTTLAMITKAEPSKTTRRQTFSRIKEETNQKEIAINSCTMSLPVDQAFNNVIQPTKITEAEMDPPNIENDEGTTQVELSESSSSRLTLNYKLTAKVMLTQSLVWNPQLLQMAATLFEYQNARDTN